MVHAMTPLVAQHIAIISKQIGRMWKRAALASL